MILKRTEALSFLSKLATDSKPFLGFVVGSWGFALFVGSIMHLTSDYISIAQDTVLQAQIPLRDVTGFEYGDARELAGRIPQALLEQPEFRQQADYLASVIEGGIVLEFAAGTEAVGFIELAIEKL